MSYNFPDHFDKNRAQELGSLVQLAYQQLEDFSRGKPLQLPEAYALAAELSVHEVGSLSSLQREVRACADFQDGPGAAAAFLGHMFKEASMAQLKEAIMPTLPFGFVATRGNDILVVIRGTISQAEWAADFDSMGADFMAGGEPWGKTTAGFNLLFRELRPQIIAALNAIREKTQDQALGPVYVTGHSLGAALAHLAAAEVYATFRALNAVPVSYTFSGPRTGDPVFAAKCKEAGLPIFRMFNTEDVVPTAPPSAVKFHAADPAAAVAEGSSRNLLGNLAGTIFHTSVVGYQHVGAPVAATFHCDDVAGNHSIEGLCKELGFELPVPAPPEVKKAVTDAATKAAAP